MTYLTLSLFLVILILLFLERRQVLKQIHRQRHILHELHQCFDVQTEYLSGEFEKTRDHSALKSYLAMLSADSDSQHMGIVDKLDVANKSITGSYSRVCDKLDDFIESSRTGHIARYNLLEHTSQRISRMEELISVWAEEKIKNEAKKGEANRTLRRHLMEARNRIAALDKEAQELGKELEDTSAMLSYQRAASQDMQKELCQELSLIKSWIREQRLDSKKLEKYLIQEFRGAPPSEVYRQELDEAALRSAVINDKL